MGLDMYLERFPRYKNATPKDINGVVDWIEYQNRDEKYANDTFKDWCGKDKPSDDFIEHFTPLIRQTGKYISYNTISEEIGYWRKANQIHKWFVDNIQNGEDDCDYHREVTKEDLEKLLDICKTVMANSKLVTGRILDGYGFDENGNMENYYSDGKIIEDASVAEDLLPSCSGFFFGSEDYDEWYLKDIEDTISICKNALAGDFENYMIYYVSSW